MNGEIPWGALPKLPVNAYWIWNGQPGQETNHHTMIYTFKFETIVTWSPTTNPTHVPSSNPSLLPSANPSDIPSYNPSLTPSSNPSFGPNESPSSHPSSPTSIIHAHQPTYHPTLTVTEPKTQETVDETTASPQNEEEDDDLNSNTNT
eukprot:250574_1